MSNIPPPPPPPPPGVPMYGAAGPPRTDGQAVAALVLGIVGLLLPICFIPPILALVFGFASKGRIDRSSGQLAGRGMSIAGIVLGIVAIAFWVPFVIIRISRV